MLSGTTCLDRVAVWMLNYDLGLCSDAMRLAPNSPDVLTLRGLVLFLTNQIPKAVQHVQQALRLDPDHTPAKLLLRRARDVERIKEEGNTLFKAGRLGEAVERYGEALEVIGQRVNEGESTVSRLTAVVF
jgi:DnaJ family protein C protein 7